MGGLGVLGGRGAVGESIKPEVLGTEDGEDGGGGAQSVQMGGSFSKTFHRFLNLNDRLQCVSFKNK